MATEDVDPRFADLDAWTLTSAMEAMWEGQLAAVAAVGRAIPAITAATNAAVQALGDRGRLIYVGAGTSAPGPRAGRRRVDADLRLAAGAAPVHCRGRRERLCDERRGRGG